MSARTRTVLAILCGLVAALLVFGYAARVRQGAESARQEALQRYGGETVTALVTTRRVLPGEAFSERNVEVRDWLVDLLPEGACGETGQVAGQRAASEIPANTPVCDSHLESGADALEVPQGTVALSVACTSQASVAGALSPGAEVDIYTLTGGSAVPLCLGVQVLRAGASGSSPWVTVAVEPAQVEAVIAAASAQGLYFALPSEDVASSARELAGPAGSQAGDPSGAVRQEDGHPAATEQPAQGDPAEPPVEVTAAEPQAEAAIPDPQAETAGTPQEEEAAE